MATSGYRIGDEGGRSRIGDDSNGSRVGGDGSVFG